MNKPKQLCIHMSGFRKWSTREPFIGVEDIRDYHMNIRKFQDVAYHTVIQKDGTIQDGRPIDLYPASCKGHNTDVWAVCLVGEFNVEMPTDKQLNSLKVFILKSVVPEFIKNGVNPKEATDMLHIFGHCDYRDPPGKRYCPGKNLHRQIPSVSNWVRNAIIKGIK